MPWETALPPRTSGYALVLELAYSTGSNPVVARHVGSTPTEGTASIGGAT